MAKELPSCGTCPYGVVPTSGHRHIRCFRGPNVVDKNVLDWCGEHPEAQARLDARKEQLSAIQRVN